MRKIKFYLLDVFGSTKYTGNQLAVFILDENIKTEQMQKIAAEINFSETSFVYPNTIGQNLFKVRIFTPTAEIPFAGHPTLGTAFTIHKHILKRKVNKITLDLPAGKIPVTLTYQNSTPDILWMRQRQPEFGRIIPGNEICPVLGLDSKDLVASFPVHEVSTGLPYFIVPLKSLEAIQQAQIDPYLYKDFIKNYNTELEYKADHGEIISSAFFLFTQVVIDESNDFHTRMFDPFYGVPEDAATGSANGCLLAYLIKHRFFETSALKLKIEQGYEMNRPSLIQSKGTKNKNGEFEIFVGGKVQYVAEGHWEI